MDRSNVDRIPFARKGTSSSSSGSSRNFQMRGSHGHITCEEHTNPYESIEDHHNVGSYQAHRLLGALHKGSGVNYGGGSSYLAGEPLDGVTYQQVRESNGFDGDGEDESPPPPQRRGLGGTPMNLPLSGQPNYSLDGTSSRHPNILHHHSDTLGGGGSSLRRSRSRPSPGIYQSTGFGYPPSGGLPENHYQQPYIGRPGLSESPTSENGSDATLTDSEIPPFPTNIQPPLQLQNGGLLIGSSLDFSTGRPNSLKRNLNSNGKLNTGALNHDVRQTADGRVYIPSSDTPKNSTSDYKTSPSSSPSKKTSASLLCKDTATMNSIRDVGVRSHKTDDDGVLHKMTRLCTSKRLCQCANIFFIIMFIVFFTLYGVGYIKFGLDETCSPVTSTPDPSNTGSNWDGDSNSLYDKRLSTNHHGPALPEAQLHDAKFNGNMRSRAGNLKRMKRSGVLSDDIQLVAAPSADSGIERNVGSQIVDGTLESHVTNGFHGSKSMETSDVGEKASFLQRESSLKYSLISPIGKDEWTTASSSSFSNLISSELRSGEMGTVAIDEKLEKGPIEFVGDPVGPSFHVSRIEPAKSSMMEEESESVWSERLNSTSGDATSEMKEDRSNDLMELSENETPNGGGTCECYCPCLDAMEDNESEETKGRSEDDEDVGAVRQDEIVIDNKEEEYDEYGDPVWSLEFSSALSSVTEESIKREGWENEKSESGWIGESAEPSLEIDYTANSDTALLDEHRANSVVSEKKEKERDESASHSPTPSDETNGGKWITPASENEEGAEIIYDYEEKLYSFTTTDHLTGNNESFHNISSLQEESSRTPKASGVMRKPKSQEAINEAKEVYDYYYDYEESNSIETPSPLIAQSLVKSIFIEENRNMSKKLNGTEDIESWDENDHANIVNVIPGTGNNKAFVDDRCCACRSVKMDESNFEEGHETIRTANTQLDASSFKEISIPSELSNMIDGYSYWNMQFYQSEGSWITWKISIPRGASIGFYARRNALPSHTHYDYMSVLRGFKSRSIRSSYPTITQDIQKFVEQGHWFISLYNDDSDAQKVVFASNISQEMTEGCPNGCTGNGECESGHCQCNAGFGGEDCSQSVCPVLCSGRGEYMNGECQCNPGWKGKECSLRHDECEISDCNGHGKCVNGKCICGPGYTGEFCGQVDCPHPNCWGHGFCMQGTCICKKGWRGPDCSLPDNEALQCLPDCSSHGTFDLESQKCNCDQGWTGEDCSHELCDIDCGRNGICIGGGCRCSIGWSGSFCNERLCDQRCGEHGQCKNGTCLCVTGWNGKHCTLEGCPNSCSGHGQCKANYEGLWECKCHSGWTGQECSIMMELNCNDSKDNDKDGLTDCEDPECCSQSPCVNSQLCVASKKPIDILLRKQPSAITASFYEKMKFLIEEGSLQNYARADAFNGSRSGVVRGKVVTPNGSGLMGVRVSGNSPLEPNGGFTLTQDDGWFDLMVNGGGAVTLQFGRSPFNSQARRVFVPWNEVVIIDTVEMGTRHNKLFLNSQPCESHDYDVMQPVVLATWKQGFQGDCSETSAILIESQVVQESVKIPGSEIQLIYHSSRVPGYLSTIQLQLTPDKIPESLKRVHLKITIEGVLFEKVFEADPDIKFTYAWNRLNVYRQKVYGVTTAIVKVGYEYDNCADVIWDVQSTTLSGHDMSISDIGGWNLDIHHRYNFHEGIIQKGDGSNIYLKHRPRVIVTTMGNGYQRSLECDEECNGIAAKQKLLAPVALATAPDGTLFVGDYNLIRRILVDGTVHTVVRLNATKVSYRYYMALSPVDSTLYISDPESHQIIKVRNVNDISSPERNWESVVGSGERCLPGDEAHCGDEALARDAKLVYPKGVAVSSDNVLYFADGTNIRKVDPDGIISTVIGDHRQKSHWKPIPCEGTLKVEEVHLRWPTELAVNPLDNALYFIDNHMILKLTADNRVRIIGGRSYHCPMPYGGYDIDLATHTALISPESITFAPNGDLYVAESNTQRTNRIRVITTDGKVSHFAGADSKCSCLNRGCSCFDEDHYLAATSKFNAISAITMSPDGALHIADQGNYRIRSVMALIPQPTSTQSVRYEIYAPETQEIYIFNRFGQHVATKNIVTGETIYTFLYNVNMSNGKLSSVTDAAGNKIQILRDYSSKVKTIENAQAQKFNLKMSRVLMLAEFSSPDGYNYTFDYHGSTGLIKSRQDSSGRSSTYSYDEFGRLTMAVSPTGQRVSLNFDLSQKGASIKVIRDGQQAETILIKGFTVYKGLGKWEEVTSVHPDGNVIRLFPWSQAISTESVPYNILGDIDPVLADSFPVPGKQKTEIAGELVNRVEWRYVARKEGRGRNKQLIQVDKKLRINGENIIVIEHDRQTKTQYIFLSERKELLNVTYDESGRPLKWSPSGGFAPVEHEYDRFGRLIGWKWDDLRESYEYDRSGRLYEIRYSDGTALTLTFKDLLTNMPMRMKTGGGSDYLLEHDGAGAFRSLTTPRGHIHTFGISTSIGHYEYQYKGPSSRDMYRIQYNDDGKILTILYPQGSGRVNYVYNKQGRLEAFIAGIRSGRFVHQESTGLLKMAEIAQSSFNLKVEYKYHGGLVKERKERYGLKTGLNNVVCKFQSDGNGRLTHAEVEINGRSVQSYTMKKNENTGLLESIVDLNVKRIYGEKRMNETLIQDSTKVFTSKILRDEVGRISHISYSVKDKPDAFKYDVEYNSRGKVERSKMQIGESAYVDNIEYDTDGYISQVTGSGHWKYNYDENGNAVQIMEQSEKASLIYDSADRVIQVGELLRYTYDRRGFLVQRGKEKFQYDDKGFLVHAVKKEQYKVWFFYDHLDRLVSWKDDQGNVTQFIYGNPDEPQQMTHIHFPKSNKHYLAVFIDGRLTSLMNPEGERYYVACDIKGSPLAVYNVGGRIVKEIHRTPFGRIVQDNNPKFYLPIDFHGGIVDRHTGIVIIGGRPYDPSIGQWMVPDWRTLSVQFQKPTDIFTYRYADNDPMTPVNVFAKIGMTSLKSWMNFFGFTTESIFGQDYIKRVIVEPSVPSKGYLVPAFGAVSGLECMANSITDGFKNVDFGQRSQLRPLFGQKENIIGRLAYNPGVFGSGLLVSRLDNGRTLVSPVQSSVVQGVLTSVLNDSFFIPYRSSHQNTFFFTKDNPHKLRDDEEELKRLGGLYNITVHDVENGIKELRLSNSEWLIAMRYGVKGSEETQRLLKHAHRRAIERAWEEEKHYISLGLDGRRAWTDEEKEQILYKGQVHGYRPLELFSIRKFPQLADDPNNVLFQKDSRRKRRKSNKRRRIRS